MRQENRKINIGIKINKLTLMSSAPRFASLTKQSNKTNFLCSLANEINWISDRIAKMIRNKAVKTLI